MSGYALSDIDPVSWEGKHLVVSCTLSFQDRQIPTYALLDTGATGIAFIDQDFVNHHDIPLVSRPSWKCGWWTWESVWLRADARMDW